jgi:hypothetical protein
VTLQVTLAELQDALETLMQDINAPGSTAQNGWFMVGKIWG